MCSESWNLKYQMDYRGIYDNNMATIHSQCHCKGIVKPINPFSLGLRRAINVKQKYEMAYNQNTLLLYILGKKENEKQSHGFQITQNKAQHQFFLQFCQYGISRITLVYMNILIYNTGALCPMPCLAIHLQKSIMQSSQRTQKRVQTIMSTHIRYSSLNQNLRHNNNKFY